MNLTQSFNPVTTTSGSFNVVVQDGGHAVVINESSANIIIKFGNLSQSYVPANDRRLYSFSGLMSQPNTVVTWQQHSLLPQTNSVNQCLIEFYDPGENVPETYPSPLVRNAAAAGPVVATSIEVSAAPTSPGTDVITVTDPNTGNVNVDVASNAIMVLGNTSAGGATGELITSSPTNNDRISSSQIESRVSVVENVGTQQTLVNGSAIVIDAPTVVVNSAASVTGITLPNSPVGDGHRFNLLNTSAGGVGITFTGSNIRDVGNAHSTGGHVTEFIWFSTSWYWNNS